MFQSISWHHHPIGIAFFVLLVLASVGAPGDPPTDLSLPQRPLEPSALEVRVTDGDTGERLACTVQLVDVHGRVVTEGDGLAGAFRCAGEFFKVMPSGPARIRVTRGPEYVVAEREVRLEPGVTNRVEMTLNRQVDLRRFGWYAGDHHVHMIHGENTVAVDFDQVALAARAEDLQGLSLAQAWAVEEPTPERLTAELNRRSTADCQLTWNLEAPKNYYLGDAGRCLGHCWNVGMRGRTAAGEDVIALLRQASAADYESSKPSYANFESHALIREQGGAVFYTHPARWWTGPWGGAGGYPRVERMRVSNLAVELPLDLLAGPTFDGLDVITSGGEVAANEKAFELWALLFNQGYRLAATASSDACFDRPGGATPGAARLYTFVEGPFSITAAAQAASQGRTMVTTGPLVLADVDGRPPGTALVADGRVRQLNLQVWSSGADTNGLGEVEILRNGKTLRRFVVDGRATWFRTNHVVSDLESAWYCVRAFGVDRRRQRAVTGAFFLDPRPWHPPVSTPARVAVRVLDADSGQPLDAMITEVSYVGPRPRPGRVHRLADGSGRLVIPATMRLRAEAPGHEPLTLSPFLDNPGLREAITRLSDEDLLDWATYERVREMLGEVELDFRLAAEKK